MTTLEETRVLVERWAHHVDAIDADSGAPKITERRVLRFVIRNELGVLLGNEAGKAAVMRKRGYRPAVMWAAADLAVRMRLRGADEWTRRVCEFAGLRALREGDQRFAEEAARAARAGLRRRA
jgi:hypothetical protein